MKTRNDSKKPVFELKQAIKSSKKKIKNNRKLVEEQLFDQCIKRAEELEKRLANLPKMVSIYLQNQKNSC